MLGVKGGFHMEALVVDAIHVRPRSQKELQNTVQRFETKWQRKAKKSQLRLRFST